MLNDLLSQWEWSWLDLQTVLMIIISALLFGIFIIAAVSCSLIIADSIRAYRAITAAIFTMLNTLPYQQKLSGSDPLDHGSNNIHARIVTLAAELAGTYETLPFRRLLVWCLVIPSRKRIAKATDNLLAIAENIDMSYDEQGKMLDTHRIRRKRLMKLLIK